MPSATQTKPTAPASTRTSLSSTPKCAVEERESGAVVHFRIDPAIWARYKTRIGSQDPAEYLYQLLRAQIEGHVY